MTVKVRRLILGIQLDLILSLRVRRGIRVMIIAALLILVRILRVVRMKVGRGQTGC